MDSRKSRIFVILETSRDINLSAAFLQNVHEPAKEKKSSSLSLSTDQTLILRYMYTCFKLPNEDYGNIDELK